MVVVEVMVHFSQKLVCGVGAGNESLPFVGSDVGRGNQSVDDVHGDGIAAPYGNETTRENGSTDRIDGFHSRLGKVAITLQRCGHDGSGQKRVGNLAKTGIRTEEEGFVLTNRSAKCPAEPIAVQWWSSKWVAPIIGVEHGVLYKLKQ